MILKTLRKTLITTSFLAGSLICSNAIAGGPEVYKAPAHPFYVGIFGGGGEYSSIGLRQSAFALYGDEKGGPLYVNALGRSQGRGAGIVGAHFGYEWLNWASASNVGLVPALEFEAYYLGSRLRGTLVNPTTDERLVATGHVFVDSLPQNTGVFVGNAVLSFTFASMPSLSPYAGFGVGGADISLSGANSTQITPAEVGINHFNSNPDASNWVLALQAKAGLRFNLTDNFRIFAEYRYLHLNSSIYTFGFTHYTTHIPTTNWVVRAGSLSYNMGVAGLEYRF